MDLLGIDEWSAMLVTLTSNCCPSLLSKRPISLTFLAGYSDRTTPVKFRWSGWCPSNCPEVQCLRCTWSYSSSFDLRARKALTRKEGSSDWTMEEEIHWFGCSANPCEWTISDSLLLGGGITHIWAKLVSFVHCGRGIPLIWFSCKSLQAIKEWVSIRQWIPLQCERTDITHM